MSQSQPVSATTPTSEATPAVSRPPHIYVDSGVAVGKAAQLLPADVGDETYTQRGTTDHFVVYYESGCQRPDVRRCRSSNLRGGLQQFAEMVRQHQHQQPAVNVYIRPGSNGGSDAGCSATGLYCDAFTAGDLERSLVVAEEDEVFMADQGAGWNCGASNGEALSRVLAAEIYPNELYPPGTGGLSAVTSFDRRGNTWSRPLCW